MNNLTYLVSSQNGVSRFSSQEHETPLKFENLEIFPTKNLYPESFSILLFNNGNQYKNNKESHALENRVTTIKRIKSEFNSFLTIKNIDKLESELKRFSSQIFNEHLNLQEKPYNHIYLPDIEARHFYIIKETFTFYEKFKGENIHSFISSNLLCSKNLTEIYKTILCISNFHDDNNTIALKLYHLIFCQDTPIFSFSQDNIYPIGIDDKLNNNFIQSSNKKLKDVYFQNQKFLKLINDPNSLWFDRALKHSFSCSNEKDSDIYFLLTWHQFLNKFKKFPSQEQVVTKEYQKLFFSLRHSIFQIEKKYKDINFSQLNTDLHDVYSCDLTVDIKNKNMFQYDFQAIETIKNLQGYLNDYPSWLAFHFSYYEQTRKPGLAQKLTIPMKEGTLDVLFNDRNRKDYFYLTLINLLVNSKIEQIDVSDDFLKILTKYPEQTAFIIEKNKYFLEKLNPFQSSETLSFYFYLFQQKFKKIHENQNYYELDLLFNKLTEDNNFPMFLNILFNFPHENNSIINCLLKNSISLKWMQNNFFQMLNIMLNDNFKLPLEDQNYFITTFYRNEDFETLLSFFKDKNYVKNYNTINYSLLEIIIKNYEKEFLHELKKDCKLLNISLSPLFKTVSRSEVSYEIFKIFKEHSTTIIDHNSRNSLKLKCLSFTNCLSHFTKDDFLFLQNLLEDDESIISINNFYFKGLQKNVWNDDGIIKILSKKNAYLLRNNNSFLLKLSKSNKNEKILEQLIYLIIPIPQKEIEYKIFNSPEIYISFLSFIKRFELNNEKTPILHDYINSFLSSPNFNIELKKYLNSYLSIENYKQLEISTIEAIIEKSLMKQDNKNNSTIQNKNQTVRKF